MRLLLLGEKLVAFRDSSGRVGVMDHMCPHRNASLVLGRNEEDGLRCPEGAFLACSFWLADNLVLLGRYEEARALFERLLALRNDVGLLSEEYDTKLGRMLGNYPQAFSHVALINTAHNLCKHEKPAEQRSSSKPEAIANSA